jgi:hypothetical protein
MILALSAEYEPDIQHSVFKINKNTDTSVLQPVYYTRNFDLSEAIFLDSNKQFIKSLLFKTKLWLS